MFLWRFDISSKIIVSGLYFVWFFSMSGSGAKSWSGKSVDELSTLGNLFGGLQILLFSQCIQP